MKFPGLIPSVALMVLIPVHSFSQTKSDDLEVGKVVHGSLELETPDTFALYIDANTFIYGVAEQISVDVAVQLQDSTGAVKGHFDGPARGAEKFTFELEEAGRYFLVLKPFEKNTGDYSMELMVREPIATEPEARADQLMLPYSGEETPGGVLGVIQDGEVLFQKAYGMANLTYALPFETGMPSNIGSVSKQFTAFAILLLEQEGKLSLEDDVRKYFPELPDLGQVVRIKNLLNHTNGYREVYNLMPMTGWKMHDELRRETVLDILQKQEELQNAPGEEYNYNNSAFILLATLVEKLSGKSFPEYMEERVFGPLGMEHTVVRSGPRTIVPRGTQGYMADSLGYIEGSDLSGSYGAGGIYTTVEDFARWMGNFGDPKLGGEELIRRMTTPDTLLNGDTMSYGLGIGIDEVNGLESWSHGGADIAHRAFLFYFPEIDGGTVAMSNNGSFNSGHIAYEMAELYFGAHMELEEDSSGDEAENPVETAEEGTEEGALEGEGKVVIPEQTLRDYAGDYIIRGAGMVLSFSYKDAMLMFTTEGQPELAMVPLSQTRFRYEGIEAWIEFKLDENGKITGGVHTQAGADHQLERVPPYDPLPGELEAYCGRYLSNELETFYQLRVRDSTLVVKIRNTDDIDLEPLKEDLFKGSVNFQGELEFIRNGEGLITGFKVSNGRTKGILFRRL